jgi:hypothetical protein
MDDVIRAGLQRDPFYGKRQAVEDLFRARPEARQPHPDTIGQHIKMHADHMAGQDTPGQGPAAATDDMYLQMLRLQVLRLTDAEWNWLLEKTWRE